MVRQLRSGGLEETRGYVRRKCGTSNGTEKDAHMALLCVKRNRVAGFNVDLGVRNTCLEGRHNYCTYFPCR